MHATAGRTAGAAVSQRRLDVIPAVRRRVAIVDGPGSGAVGADVVGPAATVEEKQQVALSHLQELHQFYGELSGMRIARKHMAWYTQDKSFSAVFNRLESCQEQKDLLTSYFSDNKLRTFENEH